MNSDTQLMHQKGLKVVLLTQLLVEAMDDIKGTTLHKGKVKQYGNILTTLLKNALKQSDNVYKADPEMTTNLFNELDALVENLATIDVVGLVMVKQIYDHYKVNPEDWENTFKLELTKLDH